MCRTRKNIAVPVVAIVHITNATKVKLSREQPNGLRTIVSDTNKTLNAVTVTIGERASQRVLNAERITRASVDALVVIIESAGPER